MTRDDLVVSLGACPRGRAVVCARGGLPISWAAATRQAHQIHFFLLIWASETPSGLLCTFEMVRPRATEDEGAGAHIHESASIGVQCAFLDEVGLLLAFLPCNKLPVRHREASPPHQLLVTRQEGDERAPPAQEDVRRCRVVCMCASAHSADKGP